MTDPQPQKPDAQNHTTTAMDAATMEELTAYLDGELDAQETQRVEQRIAADETYRSQMQDLQRTWDMLDELPIGQADSSFTRTTMEMVVGDATRAGGRSNGSWWRTPLKTALMLAIPAILFATSYGLTRQFQQDQVQAWVDDLPVIEKAERYESVSLDMAFLESLQQSGWFSNESVFFSTEHNEIVPDLFDEPTAQASVSQPSLSPTQRLEAMTPEQRNSLRRKRERFDDLSVDQRHSLRDFHHQLNEHPKTAQLLETLTNYYDWLGALPSKSRARLEGLPPSGDRLTNVVDTLRERARREFGRAGTTQLPSKDARAVFDWYDTVTRKNKRVIQRRVSDLAGQKSKERGLVLLDSKRSELIQRPLNRLVGVLIRADRDMIKNMLYANLGQLRPELSDEALEILDNQLTDNGKEELLLRWTEAANQTRSKITMPQLQRFYEQLSVVERDELDKMAYENWKRELTKRFRKDRLSKSTPATDLSDEGSMQSFIDGSDLAEPAPPEDDSGLTEEDMGLTEEDMGLPLDLVLPYKGLENSGERGLGELELNEP